MANYPTATDYKAMDTSMLRFYNERVAANSEDPIGDTEAEFGEDAMWCAVAHHPKHYDGCCAKDKKKLVQHFMSEFNLTRAKAIEDICSYTGTDFQLHYDAAINGYI